MKLAKLISFISLSVLFITLSSCNALPANTPTPAISYVDTDTPKPTLPPNDNQSIEVVSIFGPFRLNGYPPVQIEYARGPYLEMALKNTGTKPLISLAASLKLNKSFEFKFWVLPNVLLPAGRTTRTGSLLNDGEFNHGVFYPLTITGITEDNVSFSYTKQVEIIAPVDSIYGTLYLKGAPFTGKAQIYCSPNPSIGGDPPTPPYLTTVANKEYFLQILPAKEHSIWASAKLNQNETVFSDQIYKVNIQAGKTANLDLTLIPGGSLSGRFLNKDGSLVSSAGDNKWVALYHSVAPSWTYTINIAADGTYSQYNMLPGVYVIRSNLIQPANPTVIIESGKETIYNFTLNN